MAESFNFDSIPTTIFDQIIIDPDMNVDEIFQSNFVDSPDFQQLVTIKEETFEIDMTPVVRKVEVAKSMQHDCMWSGFCQDPSHPNKQKNKNFSVNAVCKNFEKELGWTSSSGEDTDDDYEFEGIGEQNMTASYPATAKLLQDSHPQQMLLNALAQAMPHPPVQYEIVNEVVRRKVVNERKYMLPRGTRIHGPWFSTEIKTPVLCMPSNQIECKNENDPLEKIVKFVPSCGRPYASNDPTRPFTVAPKIEIKPLFIYSNEQLASMPVDFDYGKHNASMSTANTAPKPKKEFQKRKGSKPIKKETKKGATKLLNPFSLEDDASFNAVQKQGSEGEPSVEKRSMHNDLERQRRIGLKNLFVELKKAIPTISAQDRVPKVNILREAISYCGKVQRDEQVLMELRKKNFHLRTQAMKLGIAPLTATSSTSSASSCDD